MCSEIFWDWMQNNDLKLLQKLYMVPNLLFPKKTENKNLNFSFICLKKNFTANKIRWDHTKIKSASALAIKTLMKSWDLSSWLTGAPIKFLRLFLHQVFAVELLLMGLRRARVMTQSLDTVECQVLRPTAQSLTGFGTSIWRWNSEKNTRMSKKHFSQQRLSRQRLFRFNYDIAQRWTFNNESWKYCQCSVITLER